MTCNFCKKCSNGRVVVTHCFIGIHKSSKAKLRWALSALLYISHPLQLIFIDDVCLPRLTVGVEEGPVTLVTDWTDYISKQFPPSPAREVDTMRLAWHIFAPHSWLGRARLACEGLPTSYMSSGSSSARQRAAQEVSTLYQVNQIKSSYMLFST